MSKINEVTNKSNWIYIAGFFIILALPVLTIPPYFFPADWGKTIVFRSVMVIILFLFLWQFLYRKNEISLPNIKNNKIIWALAGLFLAYFLANIFSVDSLFSFWGSPYRGGGFINFSFYFAFAIVAFILLKKEDWRKAFNFSIVVSVLVSIIGIIQYYGLFNKFFLAVPSRPPSTMGNPDLLALYLLLLFFITLSYSIKERKIWLKLFYVGSLAVFLFTILITGSRAGFLGLLIGSIYFFLAYPKKILSLKIGIIALLIVIFGTVFYANTVDKYPKYLENNRLFNSVVSRLSIKSLLADPRLAAWQIELSILKSKPLLGYGPENFAVGFDKFYDSSIPNITSDLGWWDKAHNIIFQTGVEAGALGIIAYLALFIVLFWQLQKTKERTENTDIKIVINGIQATLIGYLVALFFGFDSFSTYLVLFLLIGYSLHLINSEQKPLQMNIKAKGLIISALFLVLVIFLWQYNLVPFLINGQINKASDLVKQKKCDQALTLMDGVLLQHSFLDSYSRMEYVEFTKTCNNFYPENNLNYIKKDLNLMKEAVKIQPNYTRYWIFMGESEVVLASQESDLKTKSDTLKQASDYFNKALQLSPKHQEILIGLAKMEMVAGDYKKMQDYSEKCIAINPSLGDCYFYLGLSEIYLKNPADAEKNIEESFSKGYNINSEDSLNLLANTYGYILDYKNLASVYEKLITLNPNIAQYHSSLAFFYSKLGLYTEAKQEALKVLQLSPASKPNVDAFLKTLP